MLSKEAITRLLAKLENRLEHSLKCRSCVDGITEALEYTVAEAQRVRARLAEAKRRGKASAARAFALRGALKAAMPWEKIHV
ncbi:MAG: hypothetical protein ACYDIC_11245 [Desulfobaccales bacterium]